MNTTPQSNRTHIAVLGRRNVGKSSLINAITRQEISLVSDVLGTTTDPVLKSIEIHPIGACVIIDTAGFDDEGALGTLRVNKTREMLDKTNVAILCFNGEITKYEIEFANLLKAKNVPCLCVVTKCDNGKNDALIDEIKQKFSKDAICVSAKQNANIELISKKLAEIMPEDDDTYGIVGKYVNKEDIVLLVMPQDIQAPKGRLILPQVQTIRDLLDRHCIAVCTTKDNYFNALSALKKPPKLIITDSQIFDFVYENKPEPSMLTSFSVLFAIYKGDIETFVKGAKKIDELTENDRVLIAEACTHNPQDGDIGRIKIPNMLRKKISPNIKIDNVAGRDFPADLSGYSLIIHCGACMFTKKYVMSRVDSASAQQIPMTNYGIAIAKLTGILDKITI